MDESKVPIVDHSSFPAGAASEARSSSCPRPSAPDLSPDKKTDVSTVERSDTADTSTSTLVEGEPSQPQPHQYHLQPQIYQDLERWPDRPQPLTKPLMGVIAWDIHDFILCLLTSALIIKAGLCVYAARIDAEHKGANIDQCSQLTLNLVRFNLQLTTLFTIIFVLIVATTVKRIALWKAQRGAKLAHLEQFQNSVSVTATFKAIWRLRAFSWTSVFLLFVWSWYYVGSQASEREYTFQESGPKSNMQLAYISDKARSPFMDASLSSFPTVKVTDLTSRYHIYVRRTEAGVSRSPFDINGYPLTPFYDNTPANRLDPKHKRKIDSEGWLDTSEFSIQHVVNSIGTSLYTNFDDPKSKNFNTSNWSDGKIIGEFVYETTNFLANCSTATLLKQTTFPGIMPAMTVSLNMTNQTRLSMNTARTFSFWELYNTTHSLQATCNISEIHTDVQVKCTAAGCKATAVRPTANVPYPMNRAPFDDDKFAAEFFNSLLLACGTPDSTSDSTMIEADNGWEPLKAQLKADEAARINPTADLNSNAYSFFLSIGLTNHINSFYTAAMYMKYELAIEQMLLQTTHFSIKPNDTQFKFVDVYGAEVSLRYELNVGWIVVDIISNSVLLCAAVFAFWLRRKTLAPDVFGYVSSLTRDNPHINLPLGGSALSGMERSRRMRHVKVKLGDVGLSNGVGRVVMTHDGAESTSKTRRLARTKTYA